MFRIAILCLLATIAECANFDRYETTGRYPYPSSTISNLNNNFPYKSVNYGSDIANFPEVTRYPNYSPGYGYSTDRYPNYNTGYSTGSYNTLYSGGTSNVNYNQGYNNAPRYGAGYGTQYGTELGQRPSMQGGYSSYETPFMRDIGGCVNRSPQNGIWVDSLMGMWYGVEVIQHLGPDSRVDYTRTCLVIHIAEPMDRVSVVLYIVFHLTIFLLISIRACKS